MKKNSQKIHLERGKIGEEQLKNNDIEKFFSTRILNHVNRERNFTFELSRGILFYSRGLVRIRISRNRPGLRFKVSVAIIWASLLLDSWKTSLAPLPHSHWCLRRNKTTGRRLAFPVEILSTRSGPLILNIYLVPTGSYLNVRTKRKKN